MIKICAISDLHGFLPEIDPCDLVVICGDSVSLNKQTYPQSCYKWYCEEFKPWADALPCDKVLFIAGNHERGLPGHEEEYYNLFPDSDKVTFLCDDEYIYEKDEEAYRIYGTPWCHQFGNWAYMATDEQLTDIYSQIPENLDILISHDQPYGYGDIILQQTRWSTGEHIGNKPLAKAVEEKQPSLMFVGHLHSTDHSEIKIGKTSRYNVSIKDEYYQPIYQPLYLEISK